MIRIRILDPELVSLKTDRWDIFDTLLLCNFRLVLLLSSLLSWCPIHNTDPRIWSELDPDYYELRSGSRLELGPDQCGSVLWSYRFQFCSIYIVLTFKLKKLSLLETFNSKLSSTGSVIFSMAGYIPVMCSTQFCTGSGSGIRFVTFWIRILLEFDLISKNLKELIKMFTLKII